MSNIECGDKINLFEYDLEEMSVEALLGLLGVIESCDGCDGCKGEVERLKQLINEKSVWSQPRLI